MREMSTAVRRRGLPLRYLALTLLAAAVMVACAVQVNGAPGTTTGCASTHCPPPTRSQRGAPQTAHANRFTVQYFNPWQASTPDANTVTLGAATQYGNLDVQFSSSTVGAGTSAAALLSNVVNNLDTSQLSGLQDQGPIYGASIGYNSGAGETYTATYNQPNAPSVPVYLEIMASVRGTLGIVFISSSTLDPNGADPTDPRQVPNADYDQMVNSVTWA